MRSTTPVGEADVVVTRPDGSLAYHFSLPTHPFTPFPFPAAGPRTTYSAPSIFVRSTKPAGEADVVGTGSDGSLAYYFSGPGNPFTPFAVAGPGTTMLQP